MNKVKDPYNLIITGVGGQGNVLSSQLIGQTLVNKGFFVTIGETYGASQRGGAVMSHIRISKKKQQSPLIPRNKSDVVVALEPVESLRVLAAYGNPEVVVLVNTRPVYPVDVTAEKEIYPKMEDIKKALDELSGQVYYIDATEKAMQMGSPILSNMIMIGALLELELIPLSMANFIETLATRFDQKGLEVNVSALEEGRKAIQLAGQG